MRSSLRRCALLPLLLLTLLPAVATAQVPAFLSMWGTYGTGPGQFKTPGGVALDAAGLVYVLDSNDPRIQVFSHEGVYVRRWWTDSHISPVGESAIAIDPGGRLYVGDPNKRAVVAYTVDQGYIRTIAMPADTYNGPNGLAIAPNGDLLATTGSPPRVERYDGNGTRVLEWTIPGAYPGGIACDAAGNVYVSDLSGCRVLEYSGSGVLLGQWGSPGTGSGQFNYPIRIAVGPGGIVYVVDNGNARVQMFTPGGGYLGQWGRSGSGIGQFLNPIGIATAPDGSVYVCDTNNSRVQRFGSAATAIEAQSWGAVKARYR